MSSGSLGASPRCLGHLYLSITSEQHCARDWTCDILSVRGGRAEAGSDAVTQPTGLSCIPLHGATSLGWDM